MIGKYYRIYMIHSPRTDKCVINYTSQYLTKIKYNLKRNHNLTTTPIVEVPRTFNELLKLGDCDVFLLDRYDINDFEAMYIKYKLFCQTAGDCLIKIKN